MLISGFHGVHGVGSVGTRGYLCKPTYRHATSLWSKSQVAVHVIIQPSFVMSSSLIACLQYGKPSRQMGQHPFQCVTEGDPLDLVGLK
jgi:hypothetical protein